MKKWLCMALALLFVLSGACSLALAEGIDNINRDSDFPIVQEKLSLDIAFVPSDGSIDFKPENNWMATYLDNVSNLDIHWMVIDPTAMRERVALMLNSGDMPDAIMGYGFTTAEIVQYGVSGGLFREINDLMDYCPYLSEIFADQPEVKAAVTATDGKIYGFPALPNLWTYPLRFFINQRWLDNVGMQAPSTLDQLKAVLTAFRDQDANGNGDATDEIPWTGVWDESFSERNLILDAFGYVNQNSVFGNICVDYTGQQPRICYAPYAENYRAYLLYMKDLWDEKLIDRDMFTQPLTQAQATVLEGVAGMSEMSAPYVYDPDHQDDWVCVPVLVDQAGDTPVFPGPNPTYTTSMFAISADVSDEKAGALAKFADTFYSLEMYGFSTYGPEAGTELDYFHNGHYYDAEANTILYNMAEGTPGAWAHRTTYLTLWNVPGFSQNGYDPYRLLYAERYPDSAIGKQFANGVVCRNDEMSQQQAQSPYYVEGVPDLFFSAEDLERLNELVTPLDDYAASMEAKFITGEISIENEFDNFIATLESYGVKEFLDIYTRYYEAYKAA